eukprot:3776990-Pyramimonas_sp.AAC.1
MTCPGPHGPQRKSKGLLRTARPTKGWPWHGASRDYIATRRKTQLSDSKGLRQGGHGPQEPPIEPPLRLLSAVDVVVIV